MSAKSAKDATNLATPILINAVSKHCPAGFRPLEQHVSSKHFEKIQKKLITRHGKGNVTFAQGHYQLHKFGKNESLTHYKNGWMVFVKARPNKRKVKVGGVEVEAGDPDYSRECVTCGAKPVVPETGKCGPCSFGEWNTSEGRW